MWLIMTLLAFNGIDFDQVKVDQALAKIGVLKYERLENVARSGPGRRRSESFGGPRILKRGIGDGDESRADIVVGDVPGETLLITGNFYNNGNIIVIDDGVLILDKADFRLDGNIYVMNRGTMRADSTTLRFIQHYIYHRGISIGDSAKCAVYDCETYFSGYPMGITVVGWGEIVMRNVTNHDWTTAAVLQNARADLEDVGIAGEWLYGDACSATFKKVDNFLSWFFFPDQSIARLTFPAGDTVIYFYVDSTLGNVDGIGYHVAMDSCTNCLWSTIPLPGCNVTIDNSVMRATGIMFGGHDTFAITGLVNGLHYEDYTLPLTDRIYRLINTTVQTWNLYPDDTTDVTVSSSIFGELCAYDNSDATIMNAYCDGSGGHLEAAASAFLLVGFSSIFADIIAKEHGLCVVGYCAMPYGNIWATGSSIMLLVNTQFPDDPVPSDTAIVFVAAVTGPANALIDDTVAVQGSAWIDQGPHQPVDFGFYRMSYRLLGDSAWIPFGDSNAVEVRRGTLEEWSTTGLAPGNYEVRLVLRDDVGDSVECSKIITLRDTGIEDAGSDMFADGFSAVRLGTRSFFIGNADSNGKIKIFDALGRMVLQTGRRSLFWPAPGAGIFFVRCGNETLKVIAF